MLVARDEFDRFMQTPAETLTDIQRSARFYYLNKCGFGARVRAPTFGIAATQGPRLNLLRLEEDLSEAHLRLSRVFIENRPYQDFLYNTAFGIGIHPIEPSAFALGAGANTNYKDGAPLAVFFGLSEAQALIRPPTPGYPVMALVQLRLTRTKGN